MKHKSKFLSLVLRHKPELIGIKLEEGGWVDVSKLLVACVKYGQVITINDLVELATDSVKVRFVLNEDCSKIRAAQGHSVKVDLGYVAKEPPDWLHHGTQSKYILDIYKDGLKPMGRHAVHLSKDKETADAVGWRRGPDYRTLYINAKAMYENGYKFYEADNGVWLTDYVPPKYIV